MIEVTNNNFNNIYSQFENELKKCSYVSMDCEFSNLPSEGFESSLFDEGKDRYTKLRNNVENTVILQVGLTLFTFMRDLKQYTASAYKFYIIPKPFGPIQNTIAFKPSNIKFLCDNKFDFNKCFYNGISHLNQSQEKLIRKLLNNGDLINSIENTLDYTEREVATEHSSAIAAWIIHSSPGDIYNIPLDKLNDIGYHYYLHSEIRRRFTNTWTSESKDYNQITVKHVTQKEKELCAKDENDPATIDNLIDSLLGFSKIFKLLAKIKKPLVGHNLMIDLLMMYNQFYDELPKSYTTFKTNLHELFPQIFDTKLMIFEIQKLSNKVLVYETSLGRLYQAFQDKDSLIYDPYVKFIPGKDNKGIQRFSVKAPIKFIIFAICIFSVETQHLHDAGWDSYFTGFCFIKLAYYYMNFQNKNLMRWITFKECLSSVSQFANKVTLPRAKIPYIIISGKDPGSMRPPILHVCLKNGRPIEWSDIAPLFSKYGLIHRKEYSRKSLLLAASTIGCYKDILRDFQRHKELTVERFSLLRHHTGIKMALCLGILLPIGMSLWYGQKCTE